MTRRAALSCAGSAWASSWLLHLAALFAGLLAPHGWNEQRRELSFAPPTPIHWRDASGAWRAPFVFPWKSAADDPFAFEPDSDRPLPLSGPAPPAGIRSAPTASAVTCCRGSSTACASRSPSASGRPCSGSGWAPCSAASAGFRGGLFDQAITFLADLCLALPWIYLLLGIRAFLPLALPPDAVLGALILLVGLLAWARPARLARAQAAGLAEREFAVAARGLGASEAQVFRRHVLPHTLGPALIQLTLLAPQCLLAEVALSFLGLGAAEPRPSLGTALAALQDLEAWSGRPWLLWPAAILAAVVLSYHLLADELQERWGIAPPAG